MDTDKYLITFTSGNRITGPMMVTTSPRRTCPSNCTLRKTGANANVCYAEHGHLGNFIWNGLDKTAPGNVFGNGINVYTFEQLLRIVRCLVPGSVWRHNQAGDLVALPDDPTTIDREKLRRLTAANVGRRVFTFTHHRVIGHQANQDAIKEANAGGFTINLSADSIDQADQLADLGIAPVTVVVPPSQKSNSLTPSGRTVAICPARRVKGVTCSSCQVCTGKHKAIIAFPALGPAGSKMGST